MTQDSEEKETQEQEQAEAAEKQQPAEQPEVIPEEAQSQDQGETTPPEPVEAEEPSPSQSEDYEAVPDGSDQPGAVAAEGGALPSESADEPDVARIAPEAAEGAPPEQTLPESDAEAAVKAVTEELAPEPVENAEEPPAEQAVLEPEPAPTGEAERPEQVVPAEETAEKKVHVGKARTSKLTTLPAENEAEKRWYVIHAHSGHENKVRQSLENRVRQEHLEHLVSQVLLPSEEVAEVKGGKKRVTSRKIFPGYVLVEMKLTHQTWYLIRTTPGVTGFIGSGKIPTPLEPEEVESIFEQMRGEQKKPKPKVSFEKDEKVKIIEGPFTNFLGFVDEVNPERGKLKVMVEIFERLTSVELEFWQVEKI